MLLEPDLCLLYTQILVRYPKTTTNLNYGLMTYSKYKTRNRMDYHVDIVIICIVIYMYVCMEYSRITIWIHVVM